MQGEYIGNLLEKIRKDNHIKQKEVTRGICSAAMYSKIESGERIPDKFLLDYILTRLDVSPDILELIISVDDYNEIEMHDTIIELIMDGCYDKAESLLKSYQHNYTSTSIREQFYYYASSHIDLGKGAPSEKILEKLILAIEQTLPTWKSDFGSLLLSTTELEILIDIAANLYTVGDTAISTELLKKCYDYILIHVKNDDERVKTLPRCVYLYSSQVSDPINVVPKLESVYELLRENGRIYYMYPIMQQLLQNYQALYMNEKVETILRQMSALEEIRDFCEDSSFMKPYDLFLWTRCSYYLDYELIRGERVAREMTQENLADGIYENTESISRIENGKFSPQKGKYYQLMDTVGINRRRINTMLVTNNIEVLQLNEEISRYIARHDHLSATEKLDYFKDKYSTDYPNLMRQIQMLELFNTKAHTRDEMIYLLKKTQMLLEQSISLENINLRPALKDEFLLVNKIGLLYEKLDQLDESIQLYRETLNSFYSSRVDNRYYRRKLILLMENLATKLELLEEYNKEIELFKECLSLSLKLGHGSSLGRYISTLTHLHFLKNQTDIEKAALYSGSLELLKLYYRKEDYMLLEKYYRYLNTNG